MWFRKHASQVTGDGLAWVAASGAEGISELSLGMGDATDKPAEYTVRLYFMEPDNVKPGERVFDVAIGGTPVLTGFDPVKVAGGQDRIVVMEFSGIPVDGQLQLTFTAKAGKPLICGVEAVAEGVLNTPVAGGE